ncbi:MAG TPA: hemerythrin domain-containing protein [Vulgatibacter sp.]|nr:hemerythrin domain-containing protein [Vulgatibacter sp.]
MVVSIGANRAKRRVGDPVEMLEHCHARIRTFSTLALAAGTKEASDDERRDACARVERYFSIALPLHVRDEEDSVLTRLMGKDPEVDRALATMEEQHERHEARLAELLAATRAVGERPSDPAARDRLAAAAQVVVDEFAVHLEMEERVLFPAIERLLSPEAKAEIVAEQRARRQA